MNFSVLFSIRITLLTYINILCDLCMGRSSALSVTQFTHLSFKGVRELIATLQYVTLNITLLIHFTNKVKKNPRQFYSY